MELCMKWSHIGADLAILLRFPSTPEQKVSRLERNTQLDTLRHLQR